MDTISDRRIIDLHSHVLPGMDDGPADTASSLALLRQAREQGVSVVVCSPHYYPEETVKQFCSRRSTAIRQLRDALADEDDGLPELIFGAEVAYYSSLTNNPDLSDLCIEGTRLLLLELPFARWEAAVFRRVRELQLACGITPVIAHIDRYLSMEGEKNIAQLLEMKVLIQANAEFIISKKTSRKAKKMVKDGQIHLLGSDCHDPVRRPQNLALAYRQLDSWGLGAYADEIVRRSEAVLRGARVK